MKFMREEGLRIGIIRKQDLGIYDLTMDITQRTCDTQWEDIVDSYRSRIVETTEAVLIGLYGGIRGEVYFVTPLTVMLQF